MSEFAQIVVSGVGPALPGVAGAGDLVTGPAPRRSPSTRPSFSARRA